MFSTLENSILWSLSVIFSSTNSVTLGSCAIFLLTFHSPKRENFAKFDKKSISTITGSRKVNFQILHLSGFKYFQNYYGIFSK